MRTAEEEGDNLQAEATALLHDLGETKTGAGPIDLWLPEEGQWKAGHSKANVIVADLESRLAASKAAIERLTDEIRDGYISELEEWAPSTFPHLDPPTVSDGSVPQSVVDLLDRFFAVDDEQRILQQAEDHLERLLAVNQERSVDDAVNVILRPRLPPVPLKNYQLFLTTTETRMTRGLMVLLRQRLKQLLDQLRPLPTNGSDTTEFDGGTPDASGDQPYRATDPDIVAARQPTAGQLRVLLLTVCELSELKSAVGDSSVVDEQLLIDTVWMSQFRDSDVISEFLERRTPARQRYRSLLKMSQNLLEDFRAKVGGAVVDRPGWLASKEQLHLMMGRAMMKDILRIVAWEISWVLRLCQSQHNIQTGALVERGEPERPLGGPHGSGGDGRTIVCNYDRRLLTSVSEAVSFWTEAADKLGEAMKNRNLVRDGLMVHEDYFNEQAGGVSLRTLWIAADRSSIREFLETRAYSEIDFIPFRGMEICALALQTKEILGSMLERMAILPDEEAKAEYARSITKSELLSTTVDRLRDMWNEMDDPFEDLRSAVCILNSMELMRAELRDPSMADLAVEEIVAQVNQRWQRLADLFGEYLTETFEIQKALEDPDYASKMLAEKQVSFLYNNISQTAGKFIAESGSQLLSTRLGEEFKQLSVKYNCQRFVLAANCETMSNTFRKLAASELPTWNAPVGAEVIINKAIPKGVSSLQELVTLLTLDELIIQDLLRVKSNSPEDVAVSQQLFRSLGVTELPRNVCIDGIRAFDKPLRLRHQHHQSDQSSALRFPPSTGSPHPELH